MAGGNVAAAICSASVSSLLGVFLTPVLVVLVWSRGGEGGVDFSTFLNICYIILVPFVAGQFAQRWIGKWVVTVSYTHLDVYKRQGFWPGWIGRGWMVWEPVSWRPCGMILP